MDAKKYSVVTALICMLGLLLLSLFNYIVDYKGVYHEGDAVLSRHVEEYVSALRASSLGLVQIPHERLVKAEIARQSNSDCYIFGSSRVMEVSKENFPLLARECDEVSNLGVSGGGIQDLEALLYAVLDKPALKSVYIGISPWTFRYDERKAWAKYGSLYYEARNEFFGEPIVTTSFYERMDLKKFENLINAEYLKANISYLFESYFQGEWIKVVDVGGANVEDADAVTSPDGSHSYSRLYLEYKLAEGRKIDPGGYKIGAPFVQREAREELSVLVARLKERGVAVNFLMIPYHPSVWESEEYLSLGARNAMNAVSSFMAVFSASTETTLIGGFRPDVFGFTGRDFYDAIHLSGSAFGGLH